MSVIEQYTAPLLAPMIVSRNRRTMFPVSQAMISVWAYKMMLVMASHAPNRLPDRYYHEFYRTRQLPEGLEVWIATVGGDRPDGGGLVDRVFVPDAPDHVLTEPNAYAATIFGHRLLLQAFLYDGPGRADHGIDESYFIPIWPPTWPYEIWSSRTPIQKTDATEVIRSDKSFLIS